MELARGNAGGLGVDRGKVLEDLPPEVLPPEDLRVTGGGPDEAPLLGVFPGSEAEGAACFGPLEEAEPNDPVLDDLEDPDFGEWPALVGEAFDDAATPAFAAGPEGADLTGAAPAS